MMLYLWEKYCCQILLSRVMAFILRHVCARADAASGERYGRINRNNSGGRVSNDQGMRNIYVWTIKLCIKHESIVLELVLLRRQ